MRLGLFVAGLGGAALVVARYASGRADTLGSVGLAAVGIGVSLAVGYLVGWLFRRVRFAVFSFLTAVVLVGFVLRQLGLLEDPAIEADLRERAGEALEGASRLKELATSALPSGVAAGLGGILGFWSNRRASDRIGDQS